MPSDLSDHIQKWLAIVEEFVSISVSQPVDETKNPKAASLVYLYEHLLPSLNMAYRVSQEALTVCTDRFEHLAKVAPKGLFGENGSATGRMFATLFLVTRRQQEVCKKQSELYEKLASQSLKDDVLTS